MLPDSPTESGTDRNGLLSYAGEWHGLAVGAFLGVLAGATQNPAIFLVAIGLIAGKKSYQRAHMKDASRETAYTGAAFVLAFFPTLLLV